MSTQYHTGVPLKNSHPDLHNLVLACNKDGMDSLRKGNHKAAFEQLKYAEAILIANQREGEGGSLLAVTCNNLGCYYKKMGKLHAALSYLRRALKVELSMHTEDVTVAGTHLNICAIQSKLDKHDKAVQHALCALELISNKVAASEEGTEVTQDDYSVLSIAYHNVAVEREFLQQWDQAAMAYQQGFHVSKRCLGENHPMTATLQRNCNAVLEKAAKYAKDAPQGNTVNRRSPRAVGGTVGAPKASFEPPESSNAQNPTPRLPDVQNTAQKEQPSDDGMPMPQSSVRQEAADWAAAEEQQNYSQYPRRMPDAPLAPISPTSPLQQEAQPMTRGLEMPSPPGHFMPPQAMPQQAMPQQFQMPQYPQYAAPPQPQMQMPMEPQQYAPAPAMPQQYAPAPVAPAQEVASPPPPVAVAPTEPSTTPSPPLASARSVPPPAPSPARTAPPPARETRGADAALTALLAGEPEVSASAMIPTAPPEPAPTSKRPPRRPRDASSEAMSVRSRGAAADARVRKSQFVQKIAAEKIQRAWRKWHAFCRDNQDWMTTTRICATMIQARWRAHRVRKSRLDKAATLIQKRIRGFLVRHVLRRHTASVTIQRHAVGMLIRRQLKRLHAAATEMQRLVRGGQARHYVRERHSLLVHVALTLQRWARGFLGRKVAASKYAEVMKQRRRMQAIIDIQRIFRGHQGRKRSEAAAKAKQAIIQQHEAATKIQSMARRVQATDRVERYRVDKLKVLNRAATMMRKAWLAHITRRRYLELREELARHVREVVTIQRYVRGFLVRLRMWREAINAEDRQWAAVEIQRCWRGYLGRLKWELMYEQQWSREAAAMRLTRHVRGWLARTRVKRMRKRAARADFERARQRFKAAQRIQAMIRGVLVRKIISAWRENIVSNLVKIQCIWRGHKTRKLMWDALLHQRATKIAANIRGWLVRRRRLRLIASVILIQKAIRRFRLRSSDVKKKAIDQAKKREDSASAIQQKFREKAADAEVAAAKAAAPAAEETEVPAAE
eukprot:gnl/MRDRNA2_/MRDRNA2_92040_c0_seq1.p1 gnl/MRDRNA2_/MRDRNA2_92040_c0~~gnl/MRDRNA2_/MRDRNA2_92040_c0_seq1.p1  ORF type:complete len:1011 (-),score=241.41 gnl/MRDRNA2_/MRDRNA2_92040_c0_seq1:98-3130(-)